MSTGGWYTWLTKKDLEYSRQEAVQRVYKCTVRFHSHMHMKTFLLIFRAFDDNATAEFIFAESIVDGTLSLVGFLGDLVPSNMMESKGVGGGVVGKEADTFSSLGFSDGFASSDTDVDCDCIAVFNRVVMSNRRLGNVRVRKQSICEPRTSSNLHSSPQTMILFPLAHLDLADWLSPILQHP